MRRAKEVGGGVRSAPRTASPKRFAARTGHGLTASVELDGAAFGADRLQDRPEDARFASLAKVEDLR